MEAEQSLRDGFADLQIIRGVNRPVEVIGPGGSQVQVVQRTYITVAIPDSATLDRLLRHENVDYVALNRRVVLTIATLPAAEEGIEPQASSSAPNFGQEGWQIDAVQARSAWNSGFDGAGVGIGFVDTGMDKRPAYSQQDPGTTHPDIEGFGSAFANFTVGRPGNQCNDSTKHDCYWEDPIHGTRVMGAAVAQDNWDGFGALGPAPGRTSGLLQYVAKAMYRDGSTGEFVLYPEDFADAVLLITDNWDSSGCSGWFCAYANTRVGVAGIGWEDDPNNPTYWPVADAFQHAYNANNVLWFAPAGNLGGEVAVPAAYLTTIAVGAVDHNMEIWAKSGRGNALDFVAPGVDVRVTENRTFSWDGRRDLNGTSYATGIAAGVARLAFQKCPQWRAWEAFAVMTQRSIDLGAFGWDPVYGYGFVNANHLVSGWC